MKVINLPYFDDADSIEGSSEIVIQNYSSRQRIIKERVILQKNAISLVIKGQKTMQFADRTVDANDTEIHFLSKGNCIASIELSKEKEFRSILIYFDSKVLINFYVKNDAVIQSFKRKKRLEPLAFVSLKKDDFITYYIFSLQLILSGNGPLSREMRRLKLEELFLYLLENHTDAFLSFQLAKAVAENEMAIRRIVESNITSNLTIYELAFLCNMSASTFKRNFEKIYNSSPTNWLLEQKMKMAAQLLREHHEKPGEVYYKIGYESHSSFTKSFKKCYGVSPKEFATEHLTG